MLRIHNALKSSRAAIDLASIMVGIIVIGLIGGVIAATVFAVIPWAQNNAAKQQLDSVVSAESSYRGLSADKDTTLQNAAATPTNQSDPNQVVLNSTFTGSSGLAVNNLLALNTSGLYCVIATADGKDYHAYSKSGSGQWYYATSGKTQPSEYTGNAPCATSTSTPAGQVAGTVNTTVDAGTGTVPNATTGTGGTTTPGAGSGSTGGTTTPGGSATTNPTPVTTNWATAQSYDFEDNTVQGWKATKTSGTVASNSTVKRSGTYALAVKDSTNSLSVVVFPTSGGNKNWNMISGTNYRLTAWVYSPTAVRASSYFGNTYGPSANLVANTWTQITYEGVATSANTDFGIQTNATGTLYMDDVKIEVVN
jgi:hypothetical protein